MDTKFITWNDVSKAAKKVAKQIKDLNYKKIILYGIPNGGIYAAQAVYAELIRMKQTAELTTNTYTSNIYIDDILDSGHTKEKYNNKPFFTLFTKKRKSQWYLFPWEEIKNENGPIENIKRLIQYIGDDPNREGLRNTPSRVINSYTTLFSGYHKDPKDVITTFEKGSYSQIILLKDIEFYSTCEHHMLPFFGKAHIAYIPDKKVIGVSKLARILEIFTRRLQIQERICQQVTEALTKYLKPKGSACILEAQHFCMTSRGVQKQDSIMVTSSLTGCFLKEQNTRNELMNLIK